MIQAVHDAAFPGKRKGGSVPYTMADIGLPAVSLFFMRPEPFLAYQRSLEKGQQEENSRRHHMRPMLDPVHPSHLQSRSIRPLQDCATTAASRSFKGSMDAR